MEEITQVLPSRRSYTLADAFNVTTEQNEANLIVYGLVHKNGYTILSAAPKTGKTFVGLGMALSVASGQDFLGQRTQKGPVLVIDLENDWQDVLAPRLAAMCRGLGLNDEVEIYIEQPDALYLDADEGIETLDNLLSIHKPILVILDPLVAALSGDENDNGHVRRTLGDVKALCRKHDCGMLILHHTRKPQGGQSGRKTSADSRGAGDITGGSDTSIILSANSQNLNTLKVDMCRRKRSVDSIRYRLVDGEDQTLQLVTESEHQESSQNKICTAIVQLLTGKPDLATGEIKESLRLSEGAWNRAKEQLLREGRIENPSHGKWAVRRQA